MTNDYKEYMDALAERVKGLNQHFKTSGATNKMHISHLFKHVSAYEATPHQINELIADLNDALVDAKNLQKTVYVSQDGEMFFAVHCTGVIDLCLSWKQFKFVE